MSNKFFTRTTLLSMLLLLACQSNSFAMEEDSCATTEPGKASSTSDIPKTAGLGDLCALPRECIHQIFSALAFENGYNPQIPASILEGAYALCEFADVNHISHNLVLQFIVNQLIADNPDIINDDIKQATPKALAALVVALIAIERMQRGMHADRVYHIEQHEKLQNFYKKHVLGIEGYANMLSDINIYPDRLSEVKPFGYMAEFAYCITCRHKLSVGYIWDNFLRSQNFIPDTNGLEFLLRLGVDANELFIHEYNGLKKSFVMTSPIDLAKKTGCARAVELLLQFGADAEAGYKRTLGIRIPPKLSYAICKFETFIDLFIFQDMCSRYPAQFHRRPIQKNIA